MLSVETASMDSIQNTIVSSDTLSESIDLVNLAIAYGAALALSEKTQILNFRNDFLPYMGKKRRLEKTVNPFWKDYFHCR